MKKADRNIAGQSRLSPVVKSLLAVAICFWPFLSYLGNNITLGLAPGAVLPLAATLSVVVLGVSWITWRLLGRAAYGRVVCTLAVAAALFFCYELIQEAMSKLALGHIRYAAPVWGLVLLAGTTAIWFGLKPRAGYQVLAAVIGATLIVPVGQIALFYGKRLPAHDYTATNSPGRLANIARAGETSTLPDVYFFVFDAYARDDQLLSQFGFDNSEFLAELEARGFVVARRSRTNYLQTVLSLSSTLSMDYPVTDGGFDLTRLQRVLNGANSTVRNLRALGYTYVYAVPNFWHGSYCTGIEDICIGPTVNIREYHREILNLTPLGDLATFLVPDFVNRLFNATGDVTLETVRTRLSGLSIRPLFVFGHMLFPHSPYRFNPDCSYRVGGPIKGPQGYLDNLRCTNRQILPAVDWIMANRPGAIIVLQSDHGLDFDESDYQPDENQQPAGLDWEAFDGRAGILSAWRLPEPCREYLDPAITAVNTFRLVFGCLEGRAPEFIEDRFFLSSYETMKVVPYNGPATTPP